MKTHKEMHEGMNGSGQKIHMVVTVGANGRWVWIESFTNKAEADSWIKYS